MTFSARIELVMDDTPVEAALPPNGAGLSV